jgi:hypothetical protein
MRGIILKLAKYTSRKDYDMPGGIFHENQIAGDSNFGSGFTAYDGLSGPRRH